MFCTNCGKKIYDGDKFCANCGVKVRKETPEPKPVSHDIVFNPPFKVEAENGPMKYTEVLCRKSRRKKKSVRQNR